MPVAARAAGPLAAAVLALLLLRDLAGDGSSATAIVERAQRQAPADAQARLHDLERLRARLGPLTFIDRERALLFGRLGRRAEASTALAGQLRRLPVDAAALRLAARMQAAGHATPELIAELSRARLHAANLLSVVQPNAVNRAVLDDLAAALAGDGPAPVR